MESEYNETKVDLKLMIEETLKLFNNASQSLKFDIRKELIMQTVIFIDGHIYPEPSSEDKLHIFILIQFSDQLMKKY